MNLASGSATVFFAGKARRDCPLRPSSARGDRPGSRPGRRAGSRGSASGRHAGCDGSWTEPPRIDVDQSREPGSGPSDGEPVANRVQIVHRRTISSRPGFGSTTESAPPDGSSTSARVTSGSGSERLAVLVGRSGHSWRSRWASPAVAGCQTVSSSGCSIGHRDRFFKSSRPAPEPCPPRVSVSRRPAGDLSEPEDQPARSPC